MTDLELPDGELPEPVRDELEALYQPALEALRESVGATTTRRLQKDCPSCGHTVRLQAQIPNPKARLDAARFIAEQVVGRAAPKIPDKDAEEDRIVIERMVVPAETSAILDELVAAGLLVDFDAALDALAK